MLAEDDPRFANWDQDATAVEERYDLQDPAEVGPALVDGGGGGRGGLRRRCPTTPGSRRGVRSNGTVFTVETLGRYHLHDVVHHLWDVRA